MEVLVRPQDSDRPAAFSENADCDFGIGGIGISLCGLSFPALNSSLLVSVEEGAVDAALSREELSAVEAVFELDPPLPLHTVSISVIPRHPQDNSPIPVHNAFKHVFSIPLSRLRSASRI